MLSQSQEKANLPVMSNGLRRIVLAMSYSEGHPGMSLGFADVISFLWDKVMHYDVADPQHPLRDKIIFSAGHGAPLLYASLYLLTRKHQDTLTKSEIQEKSLISVEALTQYRKLNSLTPGHPEITSYIEMTTGPLGQGFAWAVGIAKASLGNVYVVASDGDLMEGVSHEAASLAASWGLTNLTVLWDDNGVTIDGEVDSAHLNTLSRFKSYGWQVLEADGHSFTSIEAAFSKSQDKKSGPTIIAFKTKIGFPSTVNDSSMHGAPIKNFEEIQKTLTSGGECMPNFNLTDAALKAWEGAAAACSYRLKSKPGKPCQIYSNTKYAVNNGAENFPGNVKIILDIEKKPISTRLASQKILSQLPFVVGSADLTKSTGVAVKGHLSCCGVREHGLLAALGGMTLSGKRSVFSTFLVFLDYARPALRLAAIMKVPLIVVATHDSICVGGDGPTHQPIEQLASLRAMPNVKIWRPADEHEVITAWGQIFRNTQGPSVLILSRQNLPHIHNFLQGKRAIEFSISSIQDQKDSFLSRTSFKLQSPENSFGTILSTGSEVNLALEAAKIDTKKHNRKWEVISVLQWPPPKRSNLVLAVEASHPQSWGVYADAVYGIDTFGVSAPGDEAYRYKGFTPEAVAAWIDLKARTLTLRRQNNLVHTASKVK